MSAIIQLNIPIAKLVELDVAEPGKHYVAYLNTGRAVKISQVVERLIHHLGRETSLNEVARTMRSEGLSASPRDIEKFIIEELVPVGLVQLPDHPTPPARKEPFLWIHLKLLSGERLRTMATRLVFLFRPSCAFTLVCAWLILLALVVRQSDFSSFEIARFTSTNSLAVLAFLLVSFVAHELGHVVSCYYYGLTPGNLGFGFYVLRPVLFTNMNEGWKLSRAQRIVTDLAGMYFQIILSLPLFLWFVFHPENMVVQTTLLLVLLTTIANLNPFLRFDGYWLITDLLGLPNVHFRVRQYLKLFFRRAAGRPVSRVGIPELRPPMRQFFAVYSLAYLTATLAFLGVGLYAIYGLLVGIYSLDGLLVPIKRLLESQSYWEFSRRLNEGGLVIGFAFMIAYIPISLLANAFLGFFRRGASLDVD